MITQKDKGFGKLTLSLHRKEYFNLDGRSGSWTFAPQIRIPLTKVDAYSVGAGEWVAGVFLGYETETAAWFFSTGASTWGFAEQEPFEVGTNLDLGLNIFGFGSSGQILWESDYRWEEDGSLLFQSGAALYWKFTDTIHSRIEWKHDFYNRRAFLSHGNGEVFKLGVGFVY